MSIFQRFSTAFRLKSINTPLALRSKLLRGNIMSSTHFTPGSPSLAHLRQRLYHSGYYGNPYSSQNKALIWGMIGLNTGVFLYQYYAKEQARDGFRGPYHDFVHNMTLNLEDVERGRWWQTITSVFTHLQPVHFGCNMLSFYMMGNPLAMVRGITPVHFATIIIGSGLCGSIGWLMTRYYKMRQSTNSWGLRSRDHTRAVGFSGAVSGLLMAAAFIMPRSRWLIMGVVPAPLWAIAIGYMAYDGYYLNKESKIAHAGHLGGAAFGLMYALLRLRGMRI